ncbi:unnamed protein product, partial [Mycena citricolor]
RQDIRHRTDQNYLVCPGRASHHQIPIVGAIIHDASHMLVSTVRDCSHQMLGSLTSSTPCRENLRYVSKYTPPFCNWQPL